MREKPSAVGFLLLLAWIHSRGAAREIDEAGKAFSTAIRVAIGPEQLRENARRRYIEGEIEVDELERQLDRIDREFPSAP